MPWEGDLHSVLNPPSKMTFWKMVRAGYGTPSQWRDACKQAKAQGWTYAQVQATLVFHPIWLITFGTLLLIISVAALRGPVHTYIDMMHGWECTSGTSDQCEQWTKKPG